MSQRQPGSIRPSFKRRIFEWIWLKACDRRTVDGLLIVGDRPEVDRIAEALSLIRRYDPVRYRRCVRDLARIWVMALTSVGQFRESTSTCELDGRFVLNENTSSELIASVIVHEATHARLFSTGIQYEEKARVRIERICIRRQLAFAATLPKESEARDWAERVMNAIPQDMSNAAMADRSFNGLIEAARHCGIPEWFIRAGIARQERRDRRRARRAPTE